jgi:DnaJ-class molecular chaperone
MKIKLLTFNQWLNNNPEIQEEDSLKLRLNGYEGTCKECNGHGEIECICDCGDCHTKDCPNCDGEGKVKIEDIKSVLFDIYQEQLYKDREHLKKHGIEVVLPGNFGL